MPRTSVRLPPFPAFAVVSLVVHAAAFMGVTRRSRPEVPPAADARPAPLVGETLDVEEAIVAAEEETAAQEPADPAPDPNPPSEPTPPVARTPARASQGVASLRSAASPASSESSAAASRPALFGAVGVRYATDLARGFTGAFPQAASPDPIWSSVAFGSAGAAEVTLVLDDGGHIASSTVGGAPSPALRRGVERTLLLLGPRVFTARAAVTRLRVTARVERNDVHDGLHGDVYALSGSSGASFTGEVGTAFFAIAAGGGRRVDVDLRMLR